MENALEEGRPVIKENANQQRTLPSQGGTGVPAKLERSPTAARENNKELRFTGCDEGGAELGSTIAGLQAADRRWNDGMVVPVPSSTRSLGLWAVVDGAMARMNGPPHLSGCRRIHIQVVDKR